MVKMLRPSVQPLRAERRIGRLTVSATVRTRGSAWMAIRDRILARDCGLCQLCRHHGRLRLACDVDHLVELADGGTDDDQNLHAVCSDCHMAKSRAAQQARLAGSPLRSAVDALRVARSATAGAVWP